MLSSKSIFHYFTTEATTTFRVRVPVGGELNLKISAVEVSLIGLPLTGNTGFDDQ